MVFNEEWQFPVTSAVDAWIYALKVDDNDLIDWLLACVNLFGVVSLDSIGVTNWCLD